MSIFNQFPWTNFREYNLDWVIRTVQDCKETVDAALADVSNAVAMYFADHIDTTLSVSGDAADAAAVLHRPDHPVQIIFPEISPGELIEYTHRIYLLLILYTNIPGCKSVF